VELLPQEASTRLFTHPMTTVVAPALFWQLSSHVPLHGYASARQSITCWQVAALLTLLSVHAKHGCAPEYA
jgi:hypothetical protein